MCFSFPFPLSKGACRCKYHPYGSGFLFFVFHSLQLFHNCCYDIKTYGLLFSVSTQINVFFNIMDPSLMLSCKQELYLHNLIRALLVLVMCQLFWYVLWFFTVGFSLSLRPQLHLQAELYAVRTVGHWLRHQ